MTVVSCAKFPETFYATPNLKHLNLADNLLERIPLSISTLVHLETLDLSRNPLITQEPSFTLPLHQLEHLHILQLSHIPLNNLDLLRPFLFSTGVSLSELYIANCNVSVIADTEISILEHQTSLKVLDMSNNQLKHIPHNFVQSVKKLTILNLSSNHLYESPQLILDSNLTTLDLSYNNLTVPVNITHLGKVKLLNLSRNKISTWSNLATSLSTKVKCLNISYNFIEVVNKDMIDFFKTMQCVDLGGNPLNCQICGILKLRDWYQHEETTRVLSFNTSESPSCSVKMKVKDVGLQYYYCADEAVAVAVLQIAMVFSMVILAGVLMWGYKFEVSYFAHLLEVKCDWLTRQSSTFQFDAFICYSEADRGFVFHELVQHLENGPEKYKLCLQDRDFVLGRYITQNIMNFLQESRKIIVVITSNFINNQVMSNTY
ncbi:toll-like receptor 2 [Anabrus simplex]|uniref:toll-like receptor 2 n=1 Tax=Anabrus simplex TaxID=316456 RepID=UPI0035A3A80A